MEKTVWPEWFFFNPFVAPVFGLSAVAVVAWVLWKAYQQGRK